MKVTCPQCGEKVSKAGLGIHKGRWCKGKPAANGSPVLAQAESPVERFNRINADLDQARQAVKDHLKSLQDAQKEAEKILNPK